MTPLESVETSGSGFLFRKFYFFLVESREKIIQCLANEVSTGLVPIQNLVNADRHSKGIYKKNLIFCLWLWSCDKTLNLSEKAEKN